MQHNLLQIVFWIFIFILIFFFFLICKRLLLKKKTFKCIKHALKAGYRNRSEFLKAKEAKFLF
jgi:predicted permease